MTTIWIVRHAEAEGNLCRRIHGHFDGNITANGACQIKDLKKRFDSIHIDACYSSDLTRTQMTAQAIYVPKGLQLQTDPAFREVDLGVWEDKPFGYLNTFESEKMKMFNGAPHKWCVQGSETYDQYTVRFISALNRLCEKHPGQSIAIVSHGAVIRGALMSLFPGLEVGHSDNTAVTKLEYESGTYSLCLLNDNSHLTEGTSIFAKQKWWRNEGSDEDDALWFSGSEVLPEWMPKLCSEHIYVANERHNCVGFVAWSSVDDQIGQIDDMMLLSAYRGRGMAIQLLGQAISSMRECGKRYAVIEHSVHMAVEALGKKLHAVPDQNGRLVFDLQVSIKQVI